MSTKQNDPRAEASRWRQRPVAAALVSVTIAAAPWAAAAVAVLVAAVINTGHLADQPRWRWALAMGGIGVVVVFLVRPLSRRFAVLPHLLRNEVQFPQFAPTRWAMARPSISRRAMRKLALRIWTDGTGPSLAEASHQLFALDHALTWFARRDLRPGQRLPAGRLQVVTDAMARDFGLDEIDRSKIWWAVLVRDLGERVTPVVAGVQPTAKARRGFPAHEVGRWLVAPLAGWIGPTVELVYGPAPLVSVAASFIERANEIALTADPTRKLTALRRELRKGSQFGEPSSVTNALASLPDEELIDILDAAVPGPVPLRTGAASGVAAVLAAVLVLVTIRIPVTPARFGDPLPSAEASGTEVTTTTNPPAPTGAYDDAVVAKLGDATIIDVRRNDAPEFANGSLKIASVEHVGDVVTVNPDFTISFQALDSPGIHRFAYWTCIPVPLCSNATVEVTVTP